VRPDPTTSRENVGQHRRVERHAKFSSVVISIAFSMLFATGQRDAWNECDRSAASRLSSGQPASV
jgi:hypothetical protein